MQPNWRDQRRQERWERREQRRAGGYGGNPMGSAIFGLLLIGGGLMFLLRNLGIVYFDSIWRYWPAILVVIGASKVASPRHPGQILPGAILMGVGGIFLLRSLGFLYGNVWGYIWPAFFIVVGLSLLVRNINGSNSWGGQSPGIVDESGSEANRIHADIVFGGIDRKVVSQAFEGGKISVVFGGANIDLRGAAMQLPEITLHADAVFGGIDLKVPESWQVEMRGSGFFGGYEDRTHRPAPSVSGQLPPKLIVSGGAVFGGVTVRN
ncbi:MAG: DUF5668 domain-containing protein [Bryobacteraceae bacterium]